MAATWSSEQLPKFENAVRKLTKQHRKLKDEPLHLAIAYLPRRQGREVQQGIFLFEVIGGVADRFGEEQDLFEATVQAAPGLPTGFDEPLHMVLTTPHEMERALEAGWPLAAEVVDAVRRDDFKVLYKDAAGQQVLAQIRSAANATTRAAHG